MSCSLDYIHLVQAGNADLDSWMRELYACAQYHDLQWAFDSVESAGSTMATNNPSLARQVFSHLKLQVAALVEVSQSRTGFLGMKSSVDKKYEARAKDAVTMLNAFAQGLNHPV